MSKYKLPARLRRFTKRLQDEVVDIGVTNFYSAKRTNIKRENLERYFSEMYEQNTDTLLVGEAPGYNGCRLTGIPFSSEHIVRHGTAKKRMFGLNNGYRASNVKAHKEQSASAIWDVLDSLESLPLLWNAFPFHPYEKDNLNSNRKPNAKELALGEEYLHELIKIFDIHNVIAIGNVADNILTKMDIKHIKVRHPSYGGKTLFKEQLLAYYRNRDRS